MANSSKYSWLLWLTILSFGKAAAQPVAINPIISPSLFKYNTSITVTYDVTGTSLANLPNAWAWVWIPDSNSDAKYNINPASNNTTLTNNAKFTKSTVDGKTLFTLTFIPSEFFTSDISSKAKLGILLKGNDWGNGQTTDYIASIWDGNFQLKLTSPIQRPLFVKSNDKISITAETPVASNFKLLINNIQVDEKSAVTNYSYQHTVTELAGYGLVKLIATADVNTKEEQFQYIISGGSPILKRPANIISGINYDSADPTKVTLCLLAPGKTSVYALGDFSNWNVLPENIMNKDGEYFWIEISELTPGLEYAFQYLVDENLFLADPYSDKILDTDDATIPSASYPGLISFPAKAKHIEWYFNRLSVFQTNQPIYQWQVTNFEKPAKEKLVVYELLIRDFFGSGSRNYQSLIDTVSYFKRLGVNAIELMPIMEYNGNESWGYNPTFMFAPDKYYGSKNKLKEFIDVCHQNGIAVILDIAMNHQDIPNSYVLMDFDFTAFKPKPTNKWFNTDARHPFSVFYDMNHESTYTKQYLDTVNYYWLNEFKVDGFRFDLSKGFTQTNNPSNVDAWSAYDASRIALLKRMADKIWNHSPDAYVILEHLSANTEEKELAEYRFNEGKGMMLWGKMTDQYNQNTMGYETNSDISGILNTTRGWSAPHLIGYMESHDEERLMFKNLSFGNVAGNYSVKNLSNSLSRMKGANLVFYTLPGPKMLWEFGELGYDVSIDFNGRVGDKPIKWEYYGDSQRKALFNHIADLIRLRKSYPVFTKGSATIVGGTSLIKFVEIKGNPYIPNPVNENQMNVEVAVNFDIVSRTISVPFAHTGTWYDYYSGGNPVQVNAATLSITLDAGEYKLYTDYPIEPSVITSLNDAEWNQANVLVYPNPSKNAVRISVENQKILQVNLFTYTGGSVQSNRINDTEWDTSSLPSGFYIVEIKTNKGVLLSKLLKE